MLIKVKVITESKEGIVKGDPFIVKVREKKERNEANKRVIFLLASYFNCKVKLVKGHKSLNKIFEICQK